MFNTGGSGTEFGYYTFCDRKEFPTTSKPRNSKLTFLFISYGYIYLVTLSHKRYFLDLIFQTNHININSES